MLPLVAALVVYSSATWSNVWSLSPFPGKQRSFAGFRPEPPLLNPPLKGEAPHGRERPSPEASNWAPLLGRAKAKVSDFELNPARWRGGGAYALSTFNKVWDHWELLEPVSLDLGKSLLKNAGSPAALIDVAAAKLDLKLSPATSPNLDLENAILACGGTGADQKPQLEKGIKALPRDMAAGAARILSVLAAAARLRDEAFAAFAEPGIPIGQTVEKLSKEALQFAMAYDLLPHSLDLVAKVDIAKLAMAEKLICSACQSLKRPRRGSFHFSWNTSLGRVELDGADHAAHRLDGALLVIDTGNQSRFVGPAQLSAISAVVACGAHDGFENCGLSSCGLSAIFNFGGEATYKAEGPGNGAAAFGCSVLFDKGGSHFECKDFGEGAAVCGIGILSSLEGHNTYDCRTQAQGLGGVKGFGALIDANGDDKYTANDTKIDNPSDQTPQHNTSLAQGCGFGRRADPGDRHSMAGGFGILANGGSNNAYKCGVFGQGVAYWYSFGALIDLGGHNDYQGVWYVQGSSAHYSVASLLDMGGHSHFVATMAQSQGQGHDYSIGLLRTMKGGDWFESVGGCLGSGRWNGLGLFLADGDNRFTGGGGEGFGGIGGMRPKEFCGALFYNRGKATFEHPPAGVKADSFWIRKEDGVLAAGMAGSG